MDFLYSFNFEELTGIPSDVLIIGLAVLVVVLIIITIINNIKMRKLRKSYQAFMKGRNGQSLENIILRRLNQIEQIIATEEENKEKIQAAMDHYDHTFQKVGLVKYNAFHDLGGKLSFSLALLDRQNNGFIINAMHSREGCFTYIKEIIDGNPVLLLAEEEKEALELALKDN